MLSSVYSSNDNLENNPNFQLPKFDYNYGWPDYKPSEPIYKDRSQLYSPSPCKIRDDDRISQFFFGSLTVVGLFIVYRILEKNK